MSPESWGRILGSNFLVLCFPIKRAPSEFHRLPTVSRQFLTRNYPRPNCLLKCLPDCLSLTREGFLSSFKINPAVRVIARQVRDKNCLTSIFAPRHQSVSSGPLGRNSPPKIHIKNSPQNSPLSNEKTQITCKHKEKPQGRTSHRDTSGHLDGVCFLFPR